MEEVVFVKDDELPTDWAYARIADGRRYLFVRASRVTPEVLSEAWAAIAAVQLPGPRAPLRTPMPAAS